MGAKGQRYLLETVAALESCGYGIHRLLLLAGATTAATPRRRRFLKLV